MRMWNVPPTVLCRQHLLGEHLECHMFASSIQKGKSMEGFLRNGLLETHNVKSRHDELAQEMARRGYNHKSPLEFETTLVEGHINVGRNFKVLRNRCPECAQRIIDFCEGVEAESCSKK